MARSAEAAKRQKIQHQQKRINDRLGLTKPMTDRAIARSDVHKLLADGEWHSTTEINDAANSTEGTRRLRELRSAGLRIENRRKADSTQHEYRLLILENTP
ncbi:hypothetical protein ACWEQW_25980 [Streptomyces nigra]